MLKVLVIGDPHFKISNVTTTCQMMSCIINTAKEKKPDLIIVLGDILDRHENIHVIPLMNSVNFLKELENIAPLYVIIGNHDRKNNQDFCTNEHPFTALKNWHNTKIIDTTENIIIDQITFTMVPYVPPGRFNEALNLVSWQNSTVIFCHQEFKGAQMGPFTSVDGDSWSENNPYIISGHIHDYQKLQNNILYIGTPIQHKFGDTCDKFIGFFIFEPKKYTHDNCSFEKIYLNIPKKKIIHLSTKEIDNFKIEPNIEAKIIITCQQNEIKNLNKNKKILSLTNNNNAKVVYKTINPTYSNSTNNLHNEKFIKLLHNNIINDPKLLPLFNDLFGHINL
jgi:DNA repair exonuclease SbcCD nuclease subunit